MASGRVVSVLAVLCFFCCLAACHAVSSNDTFVPYDDLCPTTNYTLGVSKPPQALPQEVLHELIHTNRSQLVFDVKACRNAEVLLYGVGDLESQPYPPLETHIIKIVLGHQNTSSKIESFISDSENGRNSTDVNPLDCDEFRTFAISWEGGRVRVWFNQSVGGGVVNGTAEPEEQRWMSLMEFHSTVKMQGVFGAYRLASDEGSSSGGSNSNSSIVSEWRFYTACMKTEDTASMVTRLHLAGAAIACLLFGIVIGAVCVVFAPKLIQYIRQFWTQRGEGKRRAEDAENQDELSTLVVQSLVEKAQQQQEEQEQQQEQQQQKPAAAPVVDLSLPGDDPPSTSTSSALAEDKRKAKNTYQPYHEMHAPVSKPASAKKSTAAPKTTKKPAQPAARKDSKTGSTITSSPLPALPGDDVNSSDAPAGAEAAPDAVYANAEANVYDGVVHDAPIYENRDSHTYEPLKPGTSKKK